MRYNQDKIRFNNIITYGLWDEPEIFKNLDDEDVDRLKIDSRYAGRPDLIANIYYFSAAYDWILIMYNKPINPIGWPRNNDIILIPKRSAISSIL